MTETIVEYETKALTLVEQANKLKIKTEIDFNLGGNISAALKKMKKEISAYWKESVENAKVAYDTQKDLRDADLKPVQNARKVIDLACGEWKYEQDRVARLEQARLEREAAEKAEKQRQKLMDKANAETNSLKRAALLDKAESVVAKPVFVETIEKSTRLPDGGTRSWINDITVEVVDIKQACKAIVEGNIPVTCVEFKNLKAWAKLNNIKTDIYGLKITEITRPSTRI